MNFFDTPLLKYFGGKWQMADFIIQLFPPHTSYIEPYCGGASVFLRKAPAVLEVLNDTNHDLINFFEMLRTRTDELVNALDLTPFSYEEYLRAYEPVEDPLERARRFYIRSWQSFGSGGSSHHSGWRRALSGKRFTSPDRDWSRLDGLWLSAKRLKEAQIDCLDALDCIRRYDQIDALFYVDPPYVLKSRKRSQKRYTHEMTDDDHRKLAEVLHQVKGMVILSGYPSELYQELYADWRHISKTNTTNGNSQSVEYVWISPNTDRAREPLFNYLES